MLGGCVVGCGAIGPIHAAALKKRGSLSAVCDISAEKIKDYDVQKYTSFDRALSDGDFDVVHICTPHFLHAEMTKKALSAGKYVVLEKPVGITVEQMHSLLCDKNSDKVCVMLQNRKNPCFEMLRKISDGGGYGKTVSICAFLTWHRTKEYYEADSWRGKWATEGGALLINQAIHTIDLICLLGGGYESLSGGTAARVLGDVIEAEDTADAVIKMKNGSTACFYATNCLNTNMPMRIEVSYENGHVLSYTNGILLDIYRDDARVICRDSMITPGKSYWGAGHEAVINEFYDYCEGKADSYIKLTDAVDAMNVIFDMYKRGLSR